MTASMQRAALVLALALGLLAVPFARATDKDYDLLVVLVGKKYTPATLGANCRPGPDGAPGECAKAKYPLKTKGIAAVRRGGTLQALVAVGANYVRWRAVRIDKHGKEQINASGEAWPIKNWNRRWRVKIPRELKRSTRLIGFDVLYPNAYSSFEVKVRVLRAKPKAPR
jgi:hypothetical protein